MALFSKYLSLFGGNNISLCFSGVIGSPNPVIIPYLFGNIIDVVVVLFTPVTVVLFGRYMTALALVLVLLVLGLVLDGVLVVFVGPKGHHQGTFSA